ncbi:hypothetical protein [Halomonas sp. CSM-2]|uniref:hypothetical protein n=1 Tax=Halomonas sp. CSM-2 TaxID=1975722 RepID=UPI000A281D8C|nr:hypothetical protein [Halomonas sp. CSM-2]
MKVKAIIFSILTVFLVSIFLYMQPKGPPPPPTMVSFIEAVKDQDHEQATLYLLSSHNREVYRQTYLEQNKFDENGQSYQMGFDGAWPSYSENSRTITDPREWIEDEVIQLDWMAKNLRINWKKMHLEECKETYRSRPKLTCEYSNKVWVWSFDKYHRTYEMKLSYDYKEDRIISYWIHPQD